MKYKIGDKVRIKTWKGMEKEYGLNHLGSIQNHYNTCRFTRYMESLLNANCPDRILEIRKINGSESCYYMKNIPCKKDIPCNWSDDMIEEKIIPEPIYSRFDILDIRNK